jgi:hypothetical protein
VKDKKMIMLKDETSLDALISEIFKLKCSTNSLPTFQQTTETDKVKFHRLKTLRFLILNSSSKIRTP